MDQGQVGGAGEVEDLGWTKKVFEVLEWTGTEIVKYSNCHKTEGKKLKEFIDQAVKQDGEFSELKVKYEVEREYTENLKAGQRELERNYQTANAVIGGLRQDKEFLRKEKEILKKEKENLSAKVDSLESQAATNADQLSYLKDENVALKEAQDSLMIQLSMANVLLKEEKENSKLRFKSFERGIKSKLITCVNSFEFSPETGMSILNEDILRETETTSSGQTKTEDVGGVELPDLDVTTVPGGVQGETGTDAIPQETDQGLHNSDRTSPVRFSLFSPEYSPQFTQSNRTTGSSTIQKTQQQEVANEATPRSAAQGTDSTQSTGKVIDAQPQQNQIHSPNQNDRKRKFDFEAEGSSQNQSSKKPSESSPVTPVRQFKCRWYGCQKSFKGPTWRNKHEKKFHVQGGVDGFWCTIIGCSKTFPEKKQLKHHKKRCEQQPHHCSYKGCDKTFGTRGHLHDHEREHQSRSSRRITLKTIYKCSVPGCQYESPDYTQFVNHEVSCKFKFNTNPIFADKRKSKATDNTATAVPLIVTANVVGGVTPVPVPTVVADAASPAATANHPNASEMSNSTEAPRRTSRLLPQK